MTEAKNCLICEGQIRRSKKALVAPFLADRIWDKDPFCIDLVECKDCGFLFYNPRLDPDEEGRLYRDYRGSDYFNARRTFEPWYTAELNALTASPESYNRRRIKLAEILSRHIGDRKIEKVLDHGGDHGDLVKGLISGAEAFVYEISGTWTVDGVTAISNPALCQADLVINSNVLEHVGFPRRLVEEIVCAARPSGLIFLEVPSESPFAFERLIRRIAQVGIVSLRRPSLLPAVFRPASLYLMHEHVNYYTEQTLVKLLNSCGCQVIASGCNPPETRVVLGSMAWCLGVVQ